MNIKKLNAGPNPNGSKDVETVSDGKGPDNMTILSNMPPFDKAAAERTIKEAEFLKATDSLHQKKHNTIVAHAKQEQAERAFNAELTTIDDLDEAILAEENGISKTSVEYNGKEIPVYDLTGYDIKFIQHRLDYKIVRGVSGLYNSSIAQMVINDPSIWASKMSDLPKPNNSDYYGYIISATYMDTAVNYANSGIVQDQSGGVTYGFSRLLPNSLIGTNTSDGSTPNATNINDASLASKNFMTPQYLAENSAKTYNEVAFRRYDDQGTPVKPDFIIADGPISEDQKRHAAFFNIPIINIHSKVYWDRECQSSLESIDKGLASISPDSTYDEIFATASAIQKEMAFNGGTYGMIYENLDKQPISPGSPMFRTPTIKDGSIEIKERTDKLNQLKKLEQEKRLAIIKGKLAQAIQTGQPDPDIKFISHMLEGRPFVDKDGDTKISSISMIKINMMVNDNDSVETIFQKSGPSQLYEKLAPLVDKYIAISKS